MTSLIAPVVPEQSKNAFEAVSIVKDLTAIGEDVAAGDIGSGLLDAATLAIDTASMIADPIAALAGSLASWALTYMDPLPGMMDDLVGSPTEVAAQSQTWLNIKGQIDTAQADMQSAVDSVLGEWEGEAADTYRGLSSMLGEIMTGIGSSAASVSGVLQQASEIIELIRTIIIQLVSSLVGALISYAVELAATVGFGAPAVITQATLKITATTTKAATWTEKLVTAITKAVKVIGDINKIYKVGFPVIRGVERGLTIISVKNLLSNARLIIENVQDPLPQGTP